MRDYAELDKLRIKLNSDYSKMFKEGLINKEELDISIKQIMLNIKTQYKKDGFETWQFKLK